MRQQPLPALGASAIPEDFFGVVAGRSSMSLDQMSRSTPPPGDPDNFNLFLSPYQEIEDRGGHAEASPTGLDLPQDTRERRLGNGRASRTGYRAPGPLESCVAAWRAKQFAEIGWYDTYFDPIASNSYDPVHRPRPTPEDLLVGRSAQNRRSSIFRASPSPTRSPSSTSSSRSRSASAVSGSRRTASIRSPRADRELRRRRYADLRQSS